MAKQRINPEAAPERIMQPVASPVDLFYRPQPNDWLKIAQGLSTLAPGLANLSNSVIETIAKREAVEGAIEGDRLAAMPDAQDGVATMKQPKLAKAIEDSGGISPWRAQSLLESFGRNTVLQQYSRRVEQEFEDLSNPLGPDGQLRPADYAQRRMGEIFTEVSAAIPQNSYYARKAAEATRAEVDPVVLYKLGQAYVKKTKEEHERSTVDSMTDLLRRKGVDAGPEISAFMDSFYRTTGKSADFAVAAALINDGKLKARNGDGSSTELIEHYLTNGINGRKLGATIESQLEQAIDVIGKIEEENLVKGERRKAIAVDSAMDQLYEWAEQMDEVPDSEAFQDKAAEILSGIPDGMRADIKGDFLKRVREYRSTRMQNAIQVREMEMDPSVAEHLTDQVNVLPEQDAKALIEAAYHRGDISRSTYGNLRQAIRSKKDVPEGLSTHAASEMQRRIVGGAWAGKSDELIPPSLQPRFRDVEARLLAQIRIEQASVANDPKFAAEPDPVVRTARMQTELSERINRLIATAQGENKDLIARGDRSEYFNNVLRKEAEFEAEKAAKRLTAEMGLVEVDMSGQPVMAYTNVYESVLETYVEAASSWYDRQLDKGSTPDEVSRDWRKAGKREVYGDVKSMFQDPELLNDLPADVQASIPKSYVTTQRTVRQGVSSSDMATAASASLSDLGGTAAVPQIIPWYQRVFSNKSNLSASIEDARTEAERLGKENTPERRKQFDQKLVAVHQRADELLDTIKTNKLYSFNEAGINRLQWVDEGGWLDWLDDGKSHGHLAILPDPDALASYWAIKAMKGLSQQERVSGKTVDGVRIDDAKWNPDSMLLFSGRNDLSQAVRSGEIDRVLVRVAEAGFNLTREQLIEKQMRLVSGRIPELFDPKPSPTKTTSSGLEVIFD